MILQLVSIVGALLILGGYLALQRRWLDQADLRFNLMNLIGAALLTWVAVVDRRYGFVLLEGSWTLLSLPPVLHALRRGRR